MSKSKNKPRPPASSVYTPETYNAHRSLVVESSTPSESDKRRIYNVMVIKGLDDFTPFMSLELPEQRGRSSLVAFTKDGTIVDPSTASSAAIHQACSKFSSAIEVLFSGMYGCTVAEEAVKSGNTATDIMKTFMTMLIQDGLLPDEMDTSAIRGLRLLDSPGFHPDILHVQGSVPCAFQTDELIIPAGLIAIVGGAGVGKTPMSIALGSAAGQFGHVRFGEPFAGYVSDPREAFSQVAALVSEVNVIVFDSFKDLLAGGSLMKGGLSRESMTFFSKVASLMSTLGVALVVPINPSSDDADTIALLKEAISSGVTGLFFPSNRNGKWEYLFRTGEGLERSSGEITLSFESGVPTLSGKERSANDTERAISAELGTLHVSDAVRRSLDNKFFGN